MGSLDGIIEARAAFPYISAGIAGQAEQIGRIEIETAAVFVRYPVGVATFWAGNDRKYGLNNLTICIAPPNERKAPL